MTNLISYIDPATGAILLQVAAGILISLGVVFGLWRQKIFTFFKSLKIKLFGKKEDKNVGSKTEIDEELTDLSTDDELTDLNTIASINQANSDSNFTDKDLDNSDPQAFLMDDNKSQIDNTDNIDNIDNTDNTGL